MKSPKKFIMLILSLFILLTAASSMATTESQTASPRKIAVWEAAVLGVVEGVTEYLPISSTGHLILVNHALGMSEFSDTRGPLGTLMKKNAALDSFNIVIQLGAILAVLGLYRKRVLQMLAGLRGGRSQSCGTQADDVP